MQYIDNEDLYLYKEEFYERKKMHKGVKEYIYIIF